MTIAIFALLILELVLAACIYVAPLAPLYWLVPLCVSPLLLLFFGKKPTLKSSQRVFSVVYALAMGSILLSVGNSLVYNTEFYGFNKPIYFGAFVSVYCAAVAILAGILLLLTKQHYRLFAVGMFLAIVQCCMPQNSVVLCAICYCLLIAASACVVASAAILNRQLGAAAKLLQVKNVTLPNTLRNLAIVASAVNLFLALVACRHDYVAEIASNVVCGLLNFVLMFSAMRQPMDFVAQHKMQLLQRKADVDVDTVKTQLKHQLGEQQNYPLAVTIYKVSSVVFRMKIEGLENVQEDAACFVANHYEIFGPFITVAKFPLPFRPWTDSLITTKSTLTRQIRSGVEIATRKFLVKPLRKKLPELLATPLWKTVHFARAIPVYRRNPEKIDEMWKESVTALQTGDSVLIFPEKPDVGQNYKIGGVDKFQTGFTELALHYKQQTQKDLSFYPLYIDKKGKKMVVGNKVQMDTNAPLHEEKARVANLLYEQMQELCRKCNSSHKK